MVFKNLCVLVLRTKVASALEGLINDIDADNSSIIHSCSSESLVKYHLGALMSNS